MERRDPDSDHRHTPPRRERLDRDAVIERHRHVQGYVSIVLGGGYEEAGDRGRRLVGPGDVLVHFPFDAHADRIRRDGAEVINLDLPPDWPTALAHGRLRDLDAVARIAGRSPEHLGRAVLEQTVAVQPGIADWPDQLALDLAADPRLRLGRWAALHGLDTATLSRGFRRAYGVTPAAYRCQNRARKAWGRIVGRAGLLCDIALDSGFADQAHMSRAVKALTGRTPAAWRAVA